MNEKTKMIIIGAVVVVLAFAGGTAYGKHSATKNAPTIMAGAQFGGGQGRGGFGGGRNAGGFVSGTVLSKDANGLTIQNQSGGSKIVIVGPTTTVAKSVQGALGDIAVGSSVTIVGATNTDGSITAESVQIRPAGAQKPVAPQQ